MWYDCCITFYLFLILFSDILYLNKQRLDAVEELNKTNREKQLLLEKIEQLEVEKQAGIGKGGSILNLSIFIIEELNEVLNSISLFSLLDLQLRISCNLTFVWCITVNRIIYIGITSTLKLLAKQRERWFSFENIASSLAWSIIICVV